MTVDVTMTDQRMYSLADFLGIKLIFTPGTLTTGKIQGTGKWKQDCGLLSAKLSGVISAAIAGPDTTTPMTLLVGLSGDLGLGVYFVPETMDISVLVLDTSKLGGPAATFFEREYCIMPGDGFAAMQKLAKRAFKGKLRHTLVELPVGIIKTT